MQEGIRVVHEKEWRRKKSPQLYLRKQGNIKGQHKLAPEATGTTPGDGV